MLYQGTFDVLEKIIQRPKPFEFYTTPMLWNDAYISKKMLDLHLNPKAELASRNQSFIDNSVDWITQHFNLGSKSALCDFGCGPGLYTTQFAERGVDVTGIDFSERSINHAKKTAAEKNIAINYLLQDYLHASVDQQFDLITMIYCDFCVLNPEQRKILLKKFHSLLKENGAIFLDVYSHQYFQNSTEQMTCEHSLKNGFWSDKPYYAFHNTFKYKSEHLILGKWTILEASQTREVFNWLQCYDLDTLKKEFHDAGFKVTEYYSNVAGAPYSAELPEIAVVLEAVD